MLIFKLLRLLLLTNKLKKKEDNFIVNYNIGYNIKII